MTSRRLFTPRQALATLAIAAAWLSIAGASRAGGLDIHADADAAQMGLPAYPGAIKKNDRSGDPSGFSFGVWGESFGVRVAVVSYRSMDSVDQVASFYRDALGKYGPVLDCSLAPGKSGAAQKPRDDGKSEHDKPVTCDDDKVDAGGRLYKVGTNGAQRVFKATPWHDGVTFELLHVEQHGTD